MKQMLKIREIQISLVIGFLAFIMLFFIKIFTSITSRNNNALNLDSHIHYVNNYCHFIYYIKEYT